MYSKGLYSSWLSLRMYVYVMDGMNHVFRMVIRYLLTWAGGVDVKVVLGAERRFMDPGTVILHGKLLGDEYVRDEQPPYILILEEQGRCVSPIQGPSRVLICLDV